MSIINNIQKSNFNNNNSSGYINFILFYKKIIIIKNSFNILLKNFINYDGMLMSIINNIQKSNFNNI